MKNTNKRGIKNLADICVAKGIEYAVFSPGSRCAPLVMAFNRQEKIQTFTIVDERSAAFFALGIAQQTRKPVVLVCTSGTAALNYAPAIAEAYYQRLPLLVLTADRPIEWIDQADMQSIRQPHIYSNYIKKSFVLPQHSSDIDTWMSDRIVSEAINHCVYPDFGPVHINIPMQEPLYDQIEYDEHEKPKHIKIASTQNQLSLETLEELKQIWQTCEKKLILVGLHVPSTELNTLLEDLCVGDGSVAVFVEHTANLSSSHFFHNIDRLIECFDEEQKRDFQPDLVLTIGGMIVSKKVKVYLRKYRPRYHWHFDKTAAHYDTFQALSHIIPLDATAILPHFKQEKSTHSYQKRLKDFDHLLAKKQAAYSKEIPFCDYQVMETVLHSLPQNSLLQLGNSTPVRYANLFELDDSISVYANRGVGGIDGAVSTAAGAASVCSEITTHITGDLAFFYDSNALWNRHLPHNLRIILINNDGGNIFRIIKGPDEIEELEDYFETQNPVNARQLVENFELDYYFCADNNTLKELLSTFFEKSTKAKVLEVATPNKMSAEVMRKYFEKLRE